MKFHDFPGPGPKFHDFPGLESKLSNSMTFQVFQDQYEPCVCSCLSRIKPIGVSIVQVIYECTCIFILRLVFLLLNLSIHCIDFLPVNTTEVDRTKFYFGVRCINKVIIIGAVTTVSLTTCTRSPQKLQIKHKRL